MNRYAFIALSFFAALVLALLLTPLVKICAIKLNIVDKPNERKVHKVPIPVGGGVAIYLSFFITLMSAMALYHFSGHIFTGRDLSIVISLALAGSLILVVGLIDDIRNMPPKVKLACQILIILLIIPFGVTINFLSHPRGDIIYLPRWLSIALTLFWIAGIMNAVNLLDGLDGLLAGVSSISAILFLFVSLIKGQYFIALIMAILAGSTLGFLRYNFNPAQLFMGDTGSLFLGMTFAILSVVGALKGTTTVALFVPVFIMGLPILDTLWAIVRRAKNRQPIFKADRGHIHHKLLGLGLSQRQVVLVIYAINICFGLIGLYLCHSFR
jgi:UDP-GlcNAc:undecaprenyl-phosphate/decaprenyl-phosphate GlcNAc-1-phosphate transferase